MASERPGDGTTPAAASGGTARRVGGALAAAGAAAGAVIAWRGAGGALVRGGSLVALACAALACAQLGHATLAPSARWRGVFGPAVATLRLTVALLLAATWAGDGRELWCALAVWVAVRDALAGLSAARPLLPSAIALAAAMGWSGYTGDHAAARAALVGVLAGWGAARAAQRAEGAGATGGAAASSSRTRASTGTSAGGMA